MKERIRAPLDSEDFQVAATCAGPAEIEFANECVGHLLAVARSEVAYLVTERNFLQERL
jgi:hypothetical protein